MVFWCCETHADDVVLTEVRPRCSFTRIRATARRCRAGGEGSGGKTPAGTAISGEPVAFPARAPIAAERVHTLLGARPLLAALVHIWKDRRRVDGMLADAGRKVPGWVTCLALVALPAKRTGAEVGSDAAASVHTRVHTHG